MPQFDFVTFGVLINVIVFSIIFLYMFFICVTPIFYFFEIYFKKIKLIIYIYIKLHGDYLVFLYNFKIDVLNYKIYFFFNYLFFFFKSLILSTDLIYGNLKNDYKF